MPLEASAGETVQLLSLLRVLPGQRYVGLAQWQGGKVLAKLLVGNRAERHYAREVEGARLLAEHGLCTPPLLEQGFQAGEGGWLLFDYLEDASSLGDEWRALEVQPVLSDAQRALLGDALAVIAQLHGKGLWQDDLHLDNVLRHDGRLYLIDGGGVRAETPGQPLCLYRRVAGALPVGQWRARFATRGAAQGGCQGPALASARLPAQDRPRLQPVQRPQGRVYVKGGAA